MIQNKNGNVMYSGRTKPVIAYLLIIMMVLSMLTPFSVINANAEENTTKTGEFFDEYTIYGDYIGDMVKDEDEWENLVSTGYMSEDGYLLLDITKNLDYYPPTGIQAFATGDYTYLNLGSTIDYFGWYTNSYKTISDYWGNRTAYCLEPTKSTPSAGTYEIARYFSGYSDSTPMYVGSGEAMRYIIYYMATDGPGRDEFEDKFGSLCYQIGATYSKDRETGLVHVLLSHFRGIADSSAFKGLTGKQIDALCSFAYGDFWYGWLANDSELPSTDYFQVFEFNTGTSSQNMLGWKYVEPPKYGKIDLQKVSANKSISDDNACYSYKGAVYGIYDSNGTEVDKLITGDDGWDESIDLEQGVYTVKEITPPPGYALDNETYEVTVVPEKTTRVNGTSVSDIPTGDPLHAIVQKLDADTGKASPLGNGTLNGAQFTIKYYDGQYNLSDLNGKTAKKTWIIETDKSGIAFLDEESLVSGSDALYYSLNGYPMIPIGTISIQETKAPEGYLIDSAIKVQNIVSDGQFLEETHVLNQFKMPDNVKRGGVEIEKWDLELNKKKAQGDATLKGTVIEILNKSTNPVVVEGKEYAVDEVVYTMETNDSGVAITPNDLLPFGTYLVREKTPPTGYLPEGVLSRVFSIEENGVIVKLVDAEKAIKNNPIRGGLQIEKWDIDLDKNETQGNATFEGAVFEISNMSNHAVLVEGVLYETGTVVKTIKTDKKGLAKTSINTLPYGTYNIKEVAAPEGYLAEGVLEREVKIRKNGEYVMMNTTDTTIKNKIIRGDLKFNKIEDGSNARMAYVPFSITSLTTGESHTIVTDKNGNADTSSAWNKHSNNTNRGETDKDGVWFGTADVNDEDAALPFDTYIIDELECEANEGKILLKGIEVTIERNMTVIDMGTLTNDEEDKIVLHTTATDGADGDDFILANEEAHIVDRVTYLFVHGVGEEYIIKGILMDKETGKPLLIDGREVTNEVKFVPTKSNDTIDVEFKFDASTLGGKQLVVFETLYKDGEEIASHKDIEDEGQTVTITKIEIGTTATDKATGSKEANESKSVTITDEVSYKGLTPGKEYTLKGILMDKSTNKSLLIGNKEILSEVQFTPEEPDGKVNVEFTFDATGLGGKEIVVFESLYLNEIEIATHTDIEDEGQTVKIVEVKKPEEKTPTKTPSKLPQTGDETNLALAIFLLAIASGAIIVVTYKLRKLKKDRFKDIEE